MKVRYKTEEQRKKAFWDKVEKTDTCWIWKASIRGSGSGYGQVYYHPKQWLAHRLSYKWYVGELIEGLYICHHCDNPSCVNPKHLFQTTQKGNMLDCSKKKRWPDRKGKLHPQAKLTDTDIKNIRKLIEKGISQTQVSKMYSICPANVHHIKTRKRWAHI